MKTATKQTATTTTTTAPKPARALRAKKSPVAQLASRVRRIEKLAERIVERYGWTNIIRSAAERLVQVAGDLRYEIADLPDGFSPPRKTVERIKVAVGATITLRDRVAALYDGVLDAGAAMTVVKLIPAHEAVRQVKVDGKMIGKPQKIAAAVVAKAADGTLLRLPASHIKAVRPQDVA